MVDAKDVADSAKTADYYLKRIKDLPSLMREKFAYLRNEAKSKRILILSIQDLCTLLDLEYTKGSFEYNCSEFFFSLSALLEQMGLKFVPCSIPSDLQFEDPLFVVLRPNLDNDEDIAALKDLALSKRTPTKRDLLHLSHANEKLANYNIMLRVFEALFVISHSRLGPHQRICLMQILNQLVLPSEGLSYLRACYTFAAEYRNYYCDYGNQKYCFKPLDPRQRQQINYYLALIASHGTYLQGFNPLYPYVRELEQEYIKLNPSQTNYLKIRADTASQSSSAPSLQSSLKNLNQRQAYQKKDLPLPLPEFSSSLVVFEHLHLPESLRGLFRLARAKYAAAQPLPKVEELLPLQAPSPAEHPERFIFYTRNLDLYVNFPVCLYVEQEPRQTLLTQSKISYLNYLNGKTEDAEEENLRLLWYYFIALILKPALLGYRQAECTPYLAHLQHEFNQGATPDLLFIYALHLILFEFDPSGGTLDARVEGDLLFRLAVCNSSMLARLLGYKAELQGGLDRYPELSRTVRLRFACETVLSSASLGKFINASFLTLLEQILPQDAWLSVERCPKSCTFTPFQTNQLISDNLNLILGHLYVKACISPLLIKQNLEHYCGFRLKFERSLGERISFAYRSYRNEFAYLLSSQRNPPSVLTKLILNRLSETEEHQLQHRLQNFRYQDKLDLFDALQSSYSPLAEKCLDVALSHLNLIRVPLESAIPDQVFPRFKQHKIILCELPLPEDAQLYINQLSASQMTVIILGFLLPRHDVTVRLCSHLKLPAQYEAFVLQFLKEVRELTCHELPYTLAMYSKFASQSKGSETFSLMSAYLKMMYVELLDPAHYDLALAEKFRDLFAALQIPTQERAIRKPAVVQRNSFTQLDRSLIQSKLRESLEVQEVIGQLREQQEEEEQPPAPSPESAAAAQLSSQNGSLPDNIQKLLQAIYSQRSEIMDLSEFNGLCLSLQFMSAAAAVEEINDLCYERFEEPLFDLSPEEQRIYVTLDLLTRLLS